ncbi:MAG: hypothetical protein JWM21_2326 [Acidobacteria bacterium]|nr:hypothetical protein [Acidobacteriota bacterium]
MMSENETAPTTSAPEEPKDNQAVAQSTDEITYHAVEKDGVVTAIWEMQGRKHQRTIDPRSRQGQDILRLYTTEHTEHHDSAAPAEPGEATAAGEAQAS